MVAATVVTTAIAGSTPTVVIANPANPAHLSLPIGNVYFIYISLIKLILLISTFILFMLNICF